jgi:Cro/C1-type helix-turn-helix DNA-binding protein
VRNVRTLLSSRRVDSSALAAWCGHRPAWISKILSGERGVQVKDLGKIADFFGLNVGDLFQFGIDPYLERRRHQRRTGHDRRRGHDRRQSDIISNNTHNTHNTNTVRFKKKVR